jgi:hypothetical protein
VFSDRPFGGNQLAVFPRAEGLSDEVMQQLARELNFAESTFVLPSSDPACTHRPARRGLCPGRRRRRLPGNQLRSPQHPAEWASGPAVVLSGRSKTR